jgi:hypothetical protein
MTFGVGQGQCVIDRLPGGGPSVAISGNNTCNSIVGIALHNDGRFRNTLLAQTIALELNVRYNATLGNVEITGQYMTTQDASPCDSVNAQPTGSPSVHTIPQSVLNELGSNNTVNDLLQLANDALCGAYVPSPGHPTLSDINSALSAFNEGFDECRFLVGFSNTLRAGAVINNPVGEDAIAVLAYPNPFNSNTNITFSVNTASDNLTVEVFNTVGERLATLFRGAAEAGVMYTVEFNGADIPAGIYTYRIISGNESYVDKLTLIK